MSSFLEPIVGHAPAMPRQVRMRGSVCNDKGSKKDKTPNRKRSDDLFNTGSSSSDSSSFGPRQADERAVRLSRIDHMTHLHPGCEQAESVPSTPTLMMAMQEHVEFNKRRRKANEEERHKFMERVEYRRIKAEEPDINVLEENCSPWLLKGNDEGIRSPFWYNWETGKPRRLRDGDPRF